MNIQIFGIKKSSDTRKAERFFSERNIPYHSVDLAIKGISPGELDKVCRKIAPRDLIDTESKLYRKKGMAYMDFDPQEEILENPLLMKMPVVRNGNEATCGYEPAAWTDWIKNDA